MKRLTLIFLLIQQISYAQDSTLFIGNSMTKYHKNHTLELLSQILNNQKNKHYFTDKTFNGCDLFTHLTRLPAHKQNIWGTSISYTTSEIEKAETPKFIIENSFNNIVIQETPMSVIDSSLFHKKTIKSFSKLDSIALNHKIQVYWMEPYATIYSDRSPKVSKDSIYQLTYESFQRLKKIDTNLINIPIAYITKEFQKKYPNVKLNIGGDHPNDEMQFILACCLYYTIYNGKPEEIPYLGLFRKEIKEKGLREFTYKLYKDYQLQIEGKR